MRKHEKMQLTLGFTMFFALLLIVTLIPAMRQMAIVETGDPLVADVLTIFSLLGTAASISAFLIIFFPRRRFPR